MQQGRSYSLARQLHGLLRTDWLQTLRQLGRLVLNTCVLRGLFTLEFAI